MEVMEAIKTRRSIRKYQDKAIDENILHDLLDAGFCAPSAMNFRPVHFVVIQKKDQLKKVSACGMFTKMIKNASCCIVVVGDTKKQKIHDLLVNDCSAAIENILLAAHGFGLGAVWCGVPEKRGLDRKIKELIELPDKMQAFGLIAVGYPDEIKDGKDRYEESKIHYEKW